MSWFTTALQSMTRLFKWWVVVACWEQGIRVRLGKRMKRLNPGIHFRIPFLDRIYIQSTRLRVISCPTQSISKRDKNVITFGLAVRYQIQDIVKLYQTAASVEAILLYDAISKAAQLITTAESDVDPASLEEQINATMPNHEYGLSDVQVSILSFCQARCYRFITGDAWLASGKNFDDAETSGEVK